MTVNQTGRPPTWDPAMIGRPIILDDDRAELSRRAPLVVQVGDRAALNVCEVATWDEAYGIARLVAADNDYRCIVVRCEHGMWQVWLTNTPLVGA